MLNRIEDMIMGIIIICIWIIIITIFDVFIIILYKIIIEMFTIRDQIIDKTGV